MEKLRNSFCPTLQYPSLGTGDDIGAHHAVKHIQKQCGKFSDDTDFLTFWSVIKTQGEKFNFNASQYEQCLGTSLPPHMVKVFSDIPYSKSLFEKLKILDNDIAVERYTIANDFVLSSFSALNFNRLMMIFFRCPTL